MRIASAESPLTFSANNSALSHCETKSSNNKVKILNANDFMNWMAKEMIPTAPATPPRFGTHAARARQGGFFPFLSFGFGALLACIHRITDYAVLVFAETAKTLFAEGWILCSQLINAWSAVILHIFHKPGHYLEPATPPSSPFLISSPTTSPPSPLSPNGSSSSLDSHIKSRKTARSLRFLRLSPEVSPALSPAPSSPPPASQENPPPPLSPAFLESPSVPSSSIPSNNIHHAEEDEDESLFLLEDQMEGETQHRLEDVVQKLGPSSSASQFRPISQDNDFEDEIAQEISAPKSKQKREPPPALYPSADNHSIAASSSFIKRWRRRQSAIFTSIYYFVRRLFKTIIHFPRLFRGPRSRQQKQRNSAENKPSLVVPNKSDQKRRSSASSTESSPSHSSSSDSEQQQHHRSMRRSSSSAAKKRNSNQRLHSYEKVTTGLVEDIYMAIVLFLEQSIDSFRSLLRGHPIQFASQIYSHVRTLFSPSQVIRLESLDQRSIGGIVSSAGYPFELHEAITSDGYVLQFGRIPRHDGKRAVYLQHGVFDSSFAWVANGVGSLAFRLYDAGFDVWLANFRGAEAELDGKKRRRHINPHISDREYWNYNFDSLAHCDIPAFVDKIRKVKAAEFGDIFEDKDEMQAEDSFEIIAIAHSMGAGTLLAHLSDASQRQQPHHIAQAIVLSPAGYHSTAPRFCSITGPLISLLCPFMYSFRISGIWRRYMAKATQDVFASPPLRSLVSFFVTKFILGGDVEENPLSTVHNFAFHGFHAVSTGVFKQFWQMYSHRRFERCDLGTKLNLATYGTPKPPDYLEGYKYISVPCVFVCGKKDSLIPPVCVARHYEELKKYHPELADFKEIGASHIDFTLGQSEQLLSFILKKLGPATTRLSSFSGKSSRSML